MSEKHKFDGLCKHCGKPESDPIHDPIHSVPAAAPERPIGSWAKLAPPNEPKDALITAIEFHNGRRFYRVKQCEGGLFLDSAFLAASSPAPAAPAEQQIAGLPTGASSNYVADRETEPQWVGFANGRSIAIAMPEGREPYLVIGWVQEGEPRLRRLAAAEDDAGCINVGTLPVAPAEPVSGPR